MHPVDPTVPSLGEGVDPFEAVHKALRRFMFDTLVQVGALDVTDRLELERCVNAVQRLLGVLGEPAPELHRTIQALRHGGASERRMHAAQLYRELSLQVTAQLQRIEREEEQRTRRLTGTALRDWHRTQLGALADDELREALQWMGQSLSPQELAGLLDDLRAGAVPSRFATALAALQRQLEPARWAGIVRSLGIAATTLEPLESLALAA